MANDVLKVIPVVVLTSSPEERDKVSSIFWAIINEPPPGSLGRDS